MCATWMKEPEAGPDIMDLSILPPLAGFFFFWEDEDEDLAAEHQSAGD